ncbi:hypothetical protein ACHQM5_022557 [Ranunculus cassubicifolius]
MAHLNNLVIATLSVLCLAAIVSSQNPLVPGFFIFGDSLVDNGNNNRILSLARANYMPYGIDFPAGVTGRFTNGRTVVDVLAQLLGFPNVIPSYVEARGIAMVRGVNYASGASGIRDETGDNLGAHISLNQQLQNFGRTVQEIRRIFRRNETGLVEYLSKCIFYVGMGSNDYLNNYYMPNSYTTSARYTSKAYATVLLQDYSRQLRELYSMGARKVVVTGVGQIGCIPYQLARYNGGVKGPRCNEGINNAISLFNSGLLNLVDRLNEDLELPGAKFVYVNTYKSSVDIVEKAASYGFDVVDSGCCGVGKNNGGVTCLPLQNPCANRRKYIFWDAFHPTEAANIVLANIWYRSMSKSDVYPINIQQLAML